MDNRVERKHYQSNVQCLIEKLAEVQMHLGSPTNGLTVNAELLEVAESILAVSQSLEQSVAKYDDLTGRMGAVAFEIDPQGNMLAINDVITNVAGYQPEDLTGKAWIEALFPGEFKMQIEQLLEKLKSGDVTDYEISMVGEDQKIISLEFNSANEYSPDGELQKIVGLCSDITQRKRAEERARKTQRELEQIQKIANLGTWIWDIPSDTVTWSEELYRIYGLSPEEGGHSYQDYVRRIHPEDRDKVEKTINTAYQEIRPFEFEERILRPDGEIRTLDSRGEVICGKDGRPVRMIGICHDITEQKIAQQALRERDELLRRAVIHSPVILFMLDFDGVIQLSLGKSLAQYRGVDSSIGKSIYEIYSDLPKVIENFERARRGESFSDLIEASGLAFETHYEPYVDDDGMVKGVIGVALDVTSRLQGERALRDSEERYRLLVESAREYAIFTLDTDGYVTSWNNGAEHIKGYSADEIIGRHFSVFYPQDDISNGKPNSALELAKSRGHFEYEGWRVRKDGSRFWANVVIRALFDDSGELYGFSKVTRDMTQRKQMEVELAELSRRLMEGREAERLHLAQELHDGPVQDLYSLSYNLAAFKTNLPSDANQELMDKMESSVQKVVKTLKSISGELRPPALAPYGLEKAIRSYIEEFQATNSDFAVHMDLKPDGQQLPEQVRLVLYRIFQSSFTNIVRHADASEVTLRLKFDERLVTMEIRDDGNGFNVPSRWIELAREGHLGIVGAIERVEAIGGTLNVKSAPGKGTKIVARIPLEEKSPAHKSVNKTLEIG